MQQVTSKLRQYRRASTCLILALVGCAGVDGGKMSGGNGTSGSSSPSTANIWVASWAAAATNASPPANTSGPVVFNQTIREIVKPSVGSRGTVRLHFSNYFGDKPVTIGEVHIAQQSAQAGVTNDTLVTFNGNTSVTIPAHGTMSSDSVSFSFSYGSTLAVTEYIPESWPALTHHNQGPGIVTSYTTVQGAGNKTADIAGSSFSHPTNETYLLDRVDVFGNYKGTVATFGSSTTDGYRSTPDAHMTYPEQLAKALHDAGRDDIAIANVGIAGNQVLASGDSEAGVTRFSRDVLSLPGLYAVIDGLGGNDLRAACTSAAKLISGKQYIVQQAHHANIKIYMATIAPSTFCGKQSPRGWPTRFTPAGTGQEGERFAFNAWARSMQASTVDSIAQVPPMADAIIDVDSALADPSNLSYLLPQYNSQDDVHPNDAGYGAMAKQIPASLF